ncbi:hypothetical protein CIPAW_09G217000 [Carya illinoinensis]|uniref:Uncharacterized protein n=1 Tax=Carya illinoinensis TaxID=32201 RepID=A0A8T1PKU9_CARIL|nr:hypothetical protein CIPAW_09G217000 [Carya illinoinensis]
MIKNRSRRVERNSTLRGRTTANETDSQNVPAFLLSAALLLYNPIIHNLSCGAWASETGTSSPRNASRLVIKCQGALPKDKRLLSSEESVRSNAVALLLAKQGEVRTVSDRGHGRRKS